MKKTAQAVFGILMVLVTLILTVCPAMAAEQTMQGIFGDDLIWLFTPGNSTLTIEGKGEMPSCLLWEYDYYGTCTPWHARNIYDQIRCVVIGEGVTTVGDAMFEYCTNLQEVRLPDTLRTICSSAFRNTALTEIRIPADVEFIGDRAFFGCEKLRSVTFSGSRCMEIGSDAFGDTPFLSESPYDANGFLIMNGHLLDAQKDMRGVCVVPDGVMDIASNAFSEPEEFGHGDTAKITKIVFPGSLQYIGSCAFYGCEKLKEAVFSSDVRFGWSPFYETAMSEADIEKYSCSYDVETPGTSAPTFVHIGSKDVDYPRHSYEKLSEDDYETIDVLQAYTVSAKNPYYKAVDGVLYSKDGSVLLRYPGGKEDESFTVPDGVRVIGAHAFQRYDNRRQIGLQKVILPEGVTVIRECAFDGCEKLQQVVLPSTLKTIDACAFSDTAITHMELPDGMQEIGECFLTESKITYIRIPDSVECMRGGAFCGSLLETIDGYDRVPFKTEYGMESGSFGGTPYGKALEDAASEAAQDVEPETQEPEKTEPVTVPREYGNQYFCDENDRVVESAYVKVGLFGRYRKKVVQLRFISQLPEGHSKTWYSDNPDVTVDADGRVTNRLHRPGTARIVLSAVDEYGRIYQSRTIRVYFYRFDFQLRRLRAEATQDKD